MVLGKRNISLFILLSGLALGLLGIAGFLWTCPTSCGVTKERSTEKVVKRVKSKETVKVVKTIEVRQVEERTLLTETGEAIALSEIAPKRKVALIVMKGEWCPVCRKQLKRLSDRAHEVWGAQGFVAAVTDHDPSVNRALGTRLGSSFPILSDHDHDQLKEWGLYPDGASHPIPGIVFLDEEGVVESVVKGRYPGQPQEELILEQFAR